VVTAIRATGATNLITVSGAEWDGAWRCVIYEKKRKEKKRKEKKRKEPTNALQLVMVAKSTVHAASH
jgi:hypothetical protein